MATFLLEDLSGTIEVLVFPRVFAEGSNLHNDNIVIVKGRYYLNEDEKKIFAEKINELNEFNQGPETNARGEKEENSGYDRVDTKHGRLFLKLNREDKELLGRILKLLENHSGKIPVCVYFADSKKSFKLSQEYRAEKSHAFCQNITALLGQNNVKWQ